MSDLLALPLRAESAASPLDMHFLMERGNERYAIAFGSERSKLDELARRCNSFDAMREALKSIVDQEFMAAHSEETRMKDMADIARAALESARP